MDNADNSTVGEPVVNTVLKTEDLNNENVVPSDNTCADKIVEQKSVNTSVDNSDTKHVEQLNTIIKSEKEENITIKLETVKRDDKETVENFDNTTKDKEPKQSATPHIKLEESMKTKDTDENQIKSENPNSVNINAEPKLENNMNEDEDDGEDLPDNFFDDFSNNDFMAGLDIVDDWIDDGDGDKNHFVDDCLHDDNETRDKTKHKQGSFHGEKHEQSTSKHYRERPRHEDRDHVRRDRYSRERHLLNRSRDHESGRHQRRSRDRDYDRQREERRSKNRDRNRSREELRPKEQGKSREREHVAKLQEKSKRSDDLNAEDVTDNRRDPEKTKRDIQRDKIRCAKDHEIRVFQQQLKVAETGLVPPGTELDVVLESEKKKEIEKKETEKKEIQMQLSSDERRKSVGKYKPDKRSSSRDRRRSRDHRKSPDYRHRRREYTRYDKDRSMSPRHRRRSRSMTKEEIFRRNDDLRLRIREKRRERYINELSPVSETRMSRSPSMDLSFVSNVSDREMWLRNRDRYRSRYGRSCSPISSNSLSDHGSPKRKRSKKTSFMEEIKRKLADDRPPSFDVFQKMGPQFNSPMQPVIDPPRPVPPPIQQPINPFHPQMDMIMQCQHIQPMFQPLAMCPNPYQSGPMMMGHPDLGNVMPNTLGPPMNMMMPQHDITNLPQPQQVLQQHMQEDQQQQQQQQQQIDARVNQPLNQSQPAKTASDRSIFRNDDNLKPCVSDCQALTKLFEEQKISLSDFLSVSAKPIDIQTINVHKKIQVISKCQEVVKAISDGARLCGRFFPTAMATSSEKPADGPMKWKSPLRKLNPVRFMFTTPCKRNTQEDSSKVMLNKLLTVCGFSMLPDSVPRHLLTTSKTPSLASSTPTSVGVAALPSPIRAPDPPIIVPQPPVIKCVSAFVQTDKLKCQICEIRSARKFTSCGTQTTELDTSDEGTQVYQEDLRESCVTFTPRGILKNSSSSVQSISHMTPAQLLALQQEKTPVPPSRNESFPIARGGNMDRFPATLRSPMDSRTSFSSSSMGSSPFNDSSYLSRNTSSSLGMPKNSSFLSSGNNASFVSNFSGNLDKVPFGNRPFGMSTPSRNLGTSGDNFPSNNPWGNESMGNRSSDRFSNDSNDRYSPEQTFKDSGNMNYMNRNMSSVPGRGMPSRGMNTGGYGMQNRPFYG